MVDKSMLIRLSPTPSISREFNMTASYTPSAEDVAFIEDLVSRENKYQKERREVLLTPIGWKIDGEAQSYSRLKHAIELLGEFDANHGIRDRAYDFCSPVYRSIYHHGYLPTQTVDW